MRNFEMEKNKPNLLFIKSDQHNFRYMSHRGNTEVETPNLDELASRGATFANVYCHSPICVPSRVAFLTGLMPSETEVWTNDQILNSATPTYAHALGAGGYRPVQIGRMHLNGLDQYHGFSERYVGDHNRNFLGSPRDPGTHQEHMKGTAGPNRISLIQSGAGRSAYEIHDRIVTDKTVEYINQFCSNSNNESNSFALSVGYMLPHQPYVCQKEIYQQFRHKVKLPEIKEKKFEDYHPYLQWWKENTGSTDITDEENLRCKAAYSGLVSSLDGMIGEIVKCLKKNEIFNETIIVYTSDHGDQVGEHGFWWKQTFYEDSVKVPTIISYPKMLRSNIEMNEVINHFDITATMLDLTNSPTLPRSQGKSLKNMLISDNNSWENVAISEYCMDDSNFANVSGNLGGRDVHAKPGGVQNKMIRREEWKLIFYEGYKPQIFNLKEDPQELHDRVDDPKTKEIKATLINEVLTNWNPTKIHQRMIDLKKDQLMQQEWAENTDPDDKLRWNLDPLNDSSRLDQADR
jgi:choline-sulfatase